MDETSFFSHFLVMTLYRYWPSSLSFSTCCSVRCCQFKKLHATPTPRQANNKIQQRNDLIDSSRFLLVVTGLDRITMQFQNLSTSYVFEVNFLWRAGCYEKKNSFWGVNDQCRCRGQAVYCDQQCFWINQLEMKFSIMKVTLWKYL